MDAKDLCRLFFKILFVIFNVIAALIGFIIIVLGLVSVAASRYLYIANYGWASLPIFLILMGIVLMVFTVVGIIGAGCDVKCVLFVYSLGLIICIAFIIIGCISGFIWHDILDTGIREALDSNLKLAKYNVLVDEIQEFEQCCGVNNYTDWFDSEWADNNTSDGIAVPLSCCKNQGNCRNGEDDTAFNKEDIYGEGCYGKLSVYVSEYYYAFIIAILLFALFLILGEVVTWYLMCSPSSKTRNKYETV
ncbi:Tetraspanin-7-like [Oopsacas minuta]|uniref:Tetraspanin n=1 Tax=Oopsacas minuta TaxID=111878 RepID=A0AAV7KKQ3_9METZ|nr:Tetraspanin-7-like [Oopsacas minuta]